MTSFYRLQLKKELEPISNYLTEEDPRIRAADEAILKMIHSNRRNVHDIILMMKGLDNSRESVRRKRSPRGVQQAGGKRAGDPVRSPSSNPTTPEDSMVDAKPKPHHLARRSPREGRSGGEYGRSSVAVPSPSHPMVSKWLVTTDNKNQKPIDILRGIGWRLNDYRLHEGLMSKEELKEKIELLNKELNEKQTNLFQKYDMDIYYKERILTVDEFTVEKNESFNLNDTLGTLHFSLFLPFYEQNRTVDQNCTNHRSPFLPRFYDHPQTVGLAFHTNPMFAG